MTLDKLTMEQLHGSQLEIAEVIGMEAYRKLVASYGGSSIYISKADSVMNGLRDAEIFRRFDGSNYLELAHAFNLAGHHLPPEHRPGSTPDDVLLKIPPALCATSLFKGGIAKLI